METGQKQAHSFEGFSDHDLLIRIVTLQEVQTSELATIREQQTRLWAEKAQQADLSLVRANVETLRIHKAENSRIEDHEKRLRTVERWGLMGLGGLAVIDALLYLAPHFLK